MRVLLVEDELKTAQYVSKGLSEAGHVVDVARDGNDGLQQLTRQAYDLAILDIMLPGTDGWSLLKTARSRGCEVPVLFLTAKDTVAERVRGLKLGADDYMVKPFAFSELLARVQSVGRRRPPRTESVLRIADLEVDLARHRAQRGGQLIELTAKEMALLAYLLNRRDEVVARSVLAAQVWGMHFDSNTNVVDVAIRRLRGKIDDPFDVKLIHTVRGLGYRIHEP